MQFRSLFALAYWSLAFCTALVIDSSYVNNSIGALISRQELDEDLPPCFTVCSPTSCGGSECTIGNTKRSLSQPLESIIANASRVEADVNDEHQVLSKRVFEITTRRTSGAYLDARSWDVLDGNKLCPSYAGGYRAPTFCVQQEFVRLPTDQQTLFGTARTELVGCTVLTIVSSRAVYMCHIWEDLHFLAYQRPGVRPRTIRGFQPVLDLIRNGGGPNTLDAAGPALNVNLFNNAVRDNTYAFISTPRHMAALDNPNSVQYSDRIGQLSNLIQDLLPNAAMFQRNYRVSRGDEGYEYLFGGVALFEYDPDADSNGNADWRLWYEDTNALGSSLGQAVE